MGQRARFSDNITGLVNKESFVDGQFIKLHFKDMLVKPRLFSIPFVNSKACRPGNQHIAPSNAIFVIQNAGKSIGLICVASQVLNPDDGLSLRCVVGRLKSVAIDIRRYIAQLHPLPDKSGFARFAAIF